MRRQVPDTEYYHFYNANPKGRITGDCAIRAVSVACKVPYEQVVMDMAKIQCESGYDPTATKGLELLMKKYGWVKMKQPRHDDNTKYTGKEFCEFQSYYINRQSYYGRTIDGVVIAPAIVCTMGGHHLTCIINGKIWDTWNCGYKCVGNYWVRSEYAGGRR